MEVAPGVHRLGTSFVNFYVIEDGGRLTVVDAGLPGYRRFLMEFLDSSGKKPGDIEAVVLTHAHVDHIGFSEHLRSNQHTRVLVHEDDVALATGREKARIPLGPIWRPMLLRYLAHGLAYKGFSFPTVLEVAAFDDGEVLDLPGRLQVIHAPGHTKGSCVLRFGNVLLAGDVLATVDITTGEVGPRIGPSFVNVDSEQALRSLDRLVGLDFDTVLVGHGDPWTDGIDEAVRQARQVGIW
ncbi:MAG: MBL fold metallo-hydrolase [Actinobacteria bacterium]|nr:MBL fold metallo-hydrolase [Actinomycetota bacterium]